MFTNQIGCTVWEKIIVNRTETYIPHVIQSVYCQKVTAETVSNTSRAPDHSYLFIIHDLQVNYMPKPDDKIKSGIFNDNMPPKDALTVKSVSDFRFGSPRVRHIEVTAK